MIGSLQTGVSGLQQFQDDLEVIGNNIANVNTTGYKSANMEFADTFSQTIGGSAEGPMQVGSGVMSSTISSDYSQGTINPTGIATNLAISGDGFFVVKDSSSGVSYVTRDGNFSLNKSTGDLINASGYNVQGYVGAGPYTSGSTIGNLQISAGAAATALNDTTTPAPTLTAWSIDSAGQINATLSDGTSGVIGQVVLQNFTNPQALIKEGGNMLLSTANAGAMATPAAPNTGGLGLIQSSALETSNVDLAGQMAAMITAQRAFEANAKIITTSDEVLQDLVNLKR
ncbi:MAG TPA: flagellar hook-basal body complex protein [Candidatus Angelobacter sp.]|nr:flagellar hook-basal body complex protein [Candidatus Angelobacter sp.]